MESGRGVILRLTKLSDTSLIVTWCVENRGILKTVAKGARRPKSSFVGKLDLFYAAEFEWLESRRSELHTLREVHVMEYHSQLRSQYREVLTAGYFVSLVERVMEQGQSDDAVYSLLCRALGFLNKNAATLRAFEHFENELARITGVWDGKLQSCRALEHAFGVLPVMRGDCMQLLAKK